MSGLVVSVEPTQEPVTLQEVKDYLRVDDSTDERIIRPFIESARNYFNHTSRFSMGNDVSDINHDGLPDIISLDMLPEEEVVLKTSEGDDNIQIQKLRTKKYGYHYQFTRNMLYVNQQNSGYLETALLSGIAATDWSWSSLFADFNQLFVVSRLHHFGKDRLR